MKKIISLLLAVVLMLLPLTGFAKDLDPTKPVIILKFDDLVPGSVDGFQRAYEECKALGVTAGFGIIGSGFADADSATVNKIKGWYNDGFEIWHHGDVHSVEEYSTNSYDKQLASFKNTYDIVKNKFGIEMKTFGSPHNNAGGTTAKMISENFPGMTTIMYMGVDKNYPSLNYLPNRGGLESTPHVIHTYDELVASYGSIVDRKWGYAVLQGHVNSWNDEAWATFRNYVKYLKSQGVTFMTPSEYTELVRGTYSATLLATGNGTALFSNNTNRVSGVYAQDVTFTVKPQEDYEVKSILIDGKAVSLLNHGQEASYTFKLPNKDITVEIEFGEMDYTIPHTATAKVTQGYGTVTFGNGSTSVSALKGDTLSINVTPADNYKLSILSVDGKTVAVQNDGGAYVYSAIMPYHNVEVKAYFIRTSSGADDENAAASANIDGIVSVTDLIPTYGQMMVMVVNKEAYDASNITPDDICYIDQFDTNDAPAKLASLASRNLKYGDYVVLMTSGYATYKKTLEFGTIKVGDVSADGAKLTWQVTVKPQFMVLDKLSAKLYNTAISAQSEAAILTWDDGIVTGTGDVTFDVVTNLKDAQYSSSTELEISSGAVSDRN